MPRHILQDERAAKLVNFLYRWIYFCVNNPKTADEFFPPDINFPPLKLTPCCPAVRSDNPFKGLLHTPRSRP